VKRATADGTAVDDLEKPPAGCSIVFDPKEPDLLYSGVSALYRRRVP